MRKRRNKRKLIAAPHPKKDPLQIIQKPPSSTTPPHRRLWQGAKWAIGTAVGVAGLVVTFFSLWDILAQSSPTVQIPSVSKTFNELPFTVTNPSRFFWMYDVTAICREASSTVLGDDLKIHSELTSAKFEVAPQTASLIPCAIPNAFMADANGNMIEQPTTTATIKVFFTYKTRFIWLWSRQTDPVAWGWGTSPTGQHFWAPIKPPLSPVFDKTSAR